LDSAELIAATICSARERGKEIILPVNAHFLNLAAREDWLCEFANGDGVHVVADGKGVLLAARLARSQIPKHIRFSEWVHLLFAAGEKEGLSFFFLGAKEERVRRAKERVQKEWPALKMVGTHAGYFDRNGKANEKLIRLINDCRPDILLVGMSMPVEERWVLENRDRIDVGTIVLGAGCFEWLSGRTSVAPRWMSDVHLEWLYRLIQEPRRLWKRYLIGNPQFLVRILRERYRREK
jgi:N-acetylglucosaminyldiphosphoundecaprenol N-acetyl-beta-D-mannosaminyltransferase